MRSVLLVLVLLSLSCRRSPDSDASAQDIWDLREEMEKRLRGVSFQLHELTAAILRIEELLERLAPVEEVPTCPPAKGVIGL